jgi:hypothetical protein
VVGEVCIDRPTLGAFVDSFEEFVGPFGELAEELAGILGAGRVEIPELELDESLVGLQHEPEQAHSTLEGIVQKVEHSDRQWLQVELDWEELDMQKALQVLALGP